MKKFIIAFLVLITFALGGYFVFSAFFSSNLKVSNQTAEAKKEEKKFITVINNTGEVINKIVITIDEGTEVASIENPDEKSISIEIPKEFAKYKNYTITLTDRNKYVYEVNKTIEGTTGRTEVIITSDHVVKEGNWWDKLLN